MNYFLKLQGEVYMEIKYYGDIVEKDKTAISLCRPTPRNNKIKSLRKEALDILQKLNDLYMFRNSKMKYKYLLQRRNNYFGKENATSIQMLFCFRC